MIADGKRFTSEWRAIRRGDAMDVKGAFAGLASAHGSSSNGRHDFLRRSCKVRTGGAWKHSVNAVTDATAGTKFWLGTSRCRAKFLLSEWVRASDAAAASGARSRLNRERLSHWKRADDVGWAQRDTDLSRRGPMPISR